MRSFLVAVQLLTRVPIRFAVAPREDEQARAAAWFPLVGAGVGLTAALGAWLAARLHLPSLAPWAALLAGVVVTGGFHEDGLADTADGLFGGHDRERRLEIMRDSRLGSYGVLALVLVLGSEVAALSAILPSHLWRVLVAAHAFSRAAALPLTILPYARGGERGLGRPLARRVSPGVLLFALATGSVALFLLLPLTNALACLVLALVIVVACGARFLRDLGGATGDTLGAVVKLVELGVYLICAALAT
jgi:adenosylcobinamide-GDP ribazoletransferase